MGRRITYTYTKQAIETAIVGGWNFEKWKDQLFKKKNLLEWKDYTINQQDPHKFFLDPWFWKGLQKGLGAEKAKYEWSKKDGTITNIMHWWGNTMHSFLEHLMDGKNLESFFEELIEHHKKHR